MRHLILSVLCLWIVYFGHEVEGNCSGGVTSQLLLYGDTGLTELMLRKVTRPLTCTWEVKSSTNGLHLDLTTFTIPDSDLCNEGSLQITVGEYGKYDSVALDKWCGEFYPRILQLAGHVTINLRLQPTESRAGFKIKFTSILPSQFCAHSDVNLSGSGLLYSPGFGGHWSMVPSLSCDWQITGGPGHVVQIEILQVDFSEWACSKREAELIAYDGNAHGNMIGSWCKLNTVGVTKSSRDSLHLTYINKVPHRGRGFLLKYYQVKDYITQCASFPRDVIARSTPTFISMFQTPIAGDVQCRWNITSEQPGDIVVMETVHQNLGSIGCVYVELNFFDGDTPNEAHLQRRVCAGIELASDNVIESSGSHAYLELVYNAISPSVEGIHGLVKVYSVPKDPCMKRHRIYRAGRDTSRLWISTGGSGQRVCDITIESSVPKSCVKVVISSKDGRVLSLYDFFNVYDGANSSSPRYTSTCSPVGKAYTYSTGDTLLLQYRLSPLASSVTRDSDGGFWLDFSANIDCEIGDFEVIQANTSRAKSFNFPSDQRNLTQVCRYLMKASRREVIQFHLSNHPTSVSSLSNCTNPAVIVTDDMRGRHFIGQWCGGRGDDYVSQSNRVYIQYTDDSERSDEPSVVYRATLREQCNEFLNAPQSSFLTLTSPYYPAFYPNNADCSWKITAQRSNYRVEVKVLGINMGPGENCSRDYVALHAESGVTRLCKQEIDQRLIRSRESVMQIDFHSDGQITDRGFKFFYRSIKSYQCNESLEAEPQTGTQRFISSPFFPDHYSDAMRCSYLIKTTESRLIQTQMDLAELGGSGGKCVGDSLTFYDGRDATANVIGRVCGTELVKYRSSGRYMYLVFQSNNDGVTHRGFQLQYYSVFKYEGCEGDSIGRVYGNKSSSGYILSPFYPRGFPLGTTCRWRVYVGSGYQVQVSVSKSDTIFSCIKFEVKFYDGAQSSSSSLGSWCGGEGRVFTSSDNVMTITMQSHSITQSGFKLAYIATGTGPAESRTSLILGIIIGAVVLVVIIFTVIIVCCCCSARNKRKEKRHSRKDTQSVKRGAEELTKPLPEEKPSPADSYETHLIVPSAPPMEGIDNTGFDSNNQQICNNHDVIQAMPLYPDLAPIYKTLSPNGVPVQMLHENERLASPQAVPRRKDRDTELVGEIRGPRADQIPLIHQYHVQNTSHESKEVDSRTHLVLHEIKVADGNRGVADNPMGTRREQESRGFESTQAKLNPIINGPLEREPEIELQNIKNGKKNKAMRKTGEKKLPSKSDKRFHKEELRKKSSIECDDSDSDELYNSGKRCSRARQHCDDNGPYPNGSRQFHVHSRSQLGHTVYHENGHIDWINVPPYNPNCYENTFRQCTMAARRNYFLSQGDDHYIDQNPSYQYNPSRNGMVNQHQVQVDVHPNPVVNQYGTQSPVLYSPSFLYQNQGNMVAPESCIPNQSCNCSVSMTPVPMATVPQHIWSTGNHQLIPQGQVMIPSGTMHNIQMLHYHPLHQDIRPVPLLVPRHEATANSDKRGNDAFPTFECLTTSDKSTGTDNSEMSQKDSVEESLTAEVGVGDLMPPHPSHLADLLPPSHWIRRSIRTWPVDIPYILTDKEAHLPQEEKSDGMENISLEEESADDECDEIQMKHSSDVVKNYPQSTNENEIQQFPKTKQKCGEVEKSTSSEDPPEVRDIEGGLLCQEYKKQGEIEKDILDVHQKQVVGQTGENEQNTDPNLDDLYLQKQQDSVDVQDAVLCQEGNVQATDEAFSKDVLEKQQEARGVDAAALRQREKEQDTDKESPKDDLAKKQMLLQSGFTLEDVQNLDETSV